MTLVDMSLTTGGTLSSVWYHPPLQHRHLFDITGQLISIAMTHTDMAVFAGGGGTALESTGRGRGHRVGRMRTRCAGKEEPTGVKPEHRRDG